jgi:ABC-type Fe3+/spermidine/putrescine transport system ATPase subunit
MRPRSPFVARFVGQMNFLDAVAGPGPGGARLGAVELTLPAGRDPGAAAAEPGSPLTLAIRPEEIVVGPAAQGTPNRLTTRIRSIQFLGSFTRLVLVLSGDRERVIECDVAATAFAELRAAEGAELVLALPPESLRVFRQEG